MFLTLTPPGTRTRRLGTSIFGISLIATLGAAGCGPQDIEEIIGDVRNTPGSGPAGTAIPFQVFTDDVGAQAATEHRVLIRTAQGYVSFFGHAPPAGVDLNKEWVIFYAAGTRPTAGFDPSVLSLTLVGSDTLVAVTTLSSPSKDCLVPQHVTTPSVLIKFAAQGSAAIQFFKNDSVKDCQSPTDPCAAVLCPVGSTCVSQTVQCFAAPCPPIGVCVPASPVVHCGGIAGIPCPGGGRCADDPSDSCDPNNGGADCGGICQCIETVLCVRGSVFDSSPGVCACVPQASPPPVVHCGGIAGIQCPGAGRCADDPSDSCDPNNGGADCGGICQCIETVLCARGSVFDSSPGVCVCVPQATPPPPSCGPVCDIFCTYGHVIDANGCPTCACNPPPTP